MGRSGDGKRNILWGCPIIGGSNSIFNPLSPESDQCQIFPCIITALKKQSDHEN